LRLPFQKKRAEKKSRDIIKFLDSLAGFSNAQKTPNLIVSEVGCFFLAPSKEETGSIAQTNDSVSFQYQE
jgi:hypothetical protein